MIRSVRAFHDDGRVLVWQAHRHDIADAVLRSGRLGGEVWSLRRHTIGRLSLGSLLARSAWGRRPGRERILGLWLPRSTFDALLGLAVHRVHDPSVYASVRQWRLALRWAQVSIEWHPDVDLEGVPNAAATPRLGFRQAALEAFTREAHDPFDLTPDLGRPEVLAGYAPADYPLGPELAARLAGGG